MTEEETAGQPGSPEVKSISKEQVRPFNGQIAKQEEEKKQADAAEN